VCQVGSRFRYSYIQTFAVAESETGSMFRYSDIQIFRYSDIQIFRYSDIQIFRYSDIQIFRYSDIQIFRYSDIQIFKILSLNIVFHREQTISGVLNLLTPTNNLYIGVKYISYTDISFAQYNDDTGRI
jgi:hypothetical protein